MKPMIHKAGFTLMEIALAILVLSIGMLALFGLFPAGLQMNKQAIDETQAALFAEEVLNGVRAQASTQPWNQINNNIRLPPPTPNVWANAQDLQIEVTGGGDDNFTTLVYFKSGTRGTSRLPQDYRDFGIRYRLEIRNIDTYRKSVQLHVRPGEFGTTNAYVFYTELYNHGR